MLDKPLQGAQDGAQSSERRLPLSHIKVIDIAHHRAGPTCVRHLADWGAQVIKIEQPASDSDEARDEAIKRQGFDFQNLHRNKRALTLDLKTPEGKEVFMRLAAQSDVIIENMRSTVKFKLGVDFESIRKINPRIVYGSISGFGQDGPYAARAGVDQIAQGMGGLMSVTGLPGQGPVRVGVPIADLTSGTFLALGVAIALLDREVSGEGRWVTTSLLEAQISMLDFQAARWLIDGYVPKQEGNNHPKSTPTGVFPTSDGFMNIAASGQRIYQKLCNVLGAPELFTDERFKGTAERLANRPALNELIAERTKTRPMDEWIALMEEAGIPAGPIYTIDRTFADAQVQHLRMHRPVKHAELGELNLVAQPMNISGFERNLRMPSPALGEHTDDILSELGYDQDQVRALREKKAI